jgi:aminoglycoside 3-N-acetyltransferase
LGGDSAVIVHSSLRSFGPVEDGAEAVCAALVATCGTVMVPAASGDLTGVPAPPGLERPHNAYYNAASWEEFDALLARATPYSDGLPIDRELGRIPETMRRTLAHARSPHPLASYLAVGEHARTLIAAQRLDWPLGPLEALERLGGHVLLLGVGHTVNTAIHLAEQRLGRSRFYRYARAADGVWMELPNIPGQSHRFDGIEPALSGATREVRIGECRARLIAVADVTATARRLILADPGALLCDEPECRCSAAYQQRIEIMRRSEARQ